MEKAKKTSTPRHDDKVKAGSIINTMRLYMEAVNEGRNVSVNQVVSCCQAINKGLEKVMGKPLNSL